MMHTVLLLLVFPPFARLTLTLFARLPSDRVAVMKGIFDIDFVRNSKCTCIIQWDTPLAQ